jgi:hypothetical protein
MNRQAYSRAHDAGRAIAEARACIAQLNDDGARDALAEARRLIDVACAELETNEAMAPDGRGREGRPR